MGQVGFRLANLALFVLGCWLSADVINQVGASVLIPNDPPPLPAIQPAANQGQSWSERQVILERNLFDTKVVDEPLLIEEPDVPIAETKLPLRLLGTIASSDQTIASAAIEYTQRREHVVVRVRDELEHLENVEVLRIGRGRVVLRNGDKREELILDENVAVRVAKAPTRKSRRSDRRSASRKETTRSPQDRLQELADAGGLRSPAAIFSQARILPKYQDGEMVGIELTKIKPDSFYEQVGLRDGDTLMELNGIPINNPSASKELLEAFTSSPEISVKGTHSNGEAFEMIFGEDQMAKFEELLE